MSIFSIFRKRAVPTDTPVVSASTPFRTLGSVEKCGNPLVARKSRYTIEEIYDLLNSREIASMSMDTESVITNVEHFYGSGIVNLRSHVGYLCTDGEKCIEYDPENPDGKFRIVDFKRSLFYPVLTGAESRAIANIQEERFWETVEEDMNSPVQTDLAAAIRNGLFPECSFPVNVMPKVDGDMAGIMDPKYADTHCPDMMDFIRSRFEFAKYKPGTMIYDKVKTKLNEARDISGSSRMYVSAIVGGRRRYYLDFHSGHHFVSMDNLMNIIDLPRGTQPVKGFGKMFETDKGDGLTIIRKSHKLYDDVTGKLGSAITIHNKTFNIDFIGFN